MNKKKSIFFFKKDDDEGGSGLGGLEESVGKDGESGVLTEAERQSLRQEYWEKYEIDLLRFGQFSVMLASTTNTFEFTRLRSVVQVKSSLLSCLLGLYFHECTKCTFDQTFISIQTGHFVRHQRVGE